MSIYSQHAENIDRIEARRAQLEANRIRARGDFWGGTLSMLGRLPMQIQQGRNAQRLAELKAHADADAQRRADEKAALESDNVRSQIDARTSEQATKAEQAKREQAARMLGVANGQNWAPIKKSIGALLGADAITGLPDELPPPEVIQGFQRALVGDLGKPPEVPKGPDLMQGVNPTNPAQPMMVPKEAGAIPWTNPPAPERPTNPTEASLALAAQNPDPAIAGPAKAALATMRQQHPPAAQGTNALEGDDVNAIADAIIAGEQPPTLTGLYRNAAPVRAALARKGYDLATATTDWQATQKHVATLNGAQQTRLNQAINALPELLDSVDTLASQWKGGRFPILNKANLALAKGGAYGADVAAVARQLDTQIADVTADLGNVYMGGNSPTDFALGLASKALSAEWDEQTLHKMVALAKKNVTIRRNSITNTGVQGASPTNRYAPQSATPGADPLGIR